MSYHRRPLFRFLLLAILSTVLLIGVCTLAFDAADGGRFGPRLDGKRVLGGWLLEATALTALFLLIQGRGGSWWLDGLLSAWLAWVFRGPMLLLTVAEIHGGSGDSLRLLTLCWLATYSLCGLLIALLARRLGIRRLGVGVRR